jgi:hypothetical protein
MVLKEREIIHPSLSLFSIPSEVLNHDLLHPSVSSWRILVCDLQYHTELLEKGYRGRQEIPPKEKV